MVTSNGARPPLPVRAVLFVVFRCLKAIRHAGQRIKIAWRGFRYRVRATAPGRAAWKAVAFARAPRETRHRQRVAARYSAQLSCEEMPRERGFCLLPPGHLEGISQVLWTCRDLFEQKLVEADDVSAAPGLERDRQLKMRAAKREYLRNLLNNDDLRQHPSLVDFALSDGLLGVATKYLGMVPYLNRVDLLYSVPRLGDEKVSSQLFHVDPEGLSQVKFFINVFDVDDSHGPFAFIPADDTARVVRDVSAFRRAQGKQYAGRYLDDEIAAVGSTDAIIYVKGAPGSAVAVDTSRCLHMGSRVRPGAFRLCLYLQYCTTRERGNVFDVQRYDHDPVRRLAVRHSLESAGADVSAPHQMAGGL